jgi:hypothetical protein
MTPQELMDSISDAERQERIKRGLPPDHLLQWAQFPFAFAKNALRKLDSATAEWMRQTPLPGEAVWFRAVAAAAHKDYATANKLMDKFQPLVPDKGQGRIRFGAPPPPSTLTLPPVVGEYPKDAAFFLSCNDSYFRNFCVPLLVSLGDHSPGLRVHLHIMDPDLEVLALVANRLKLQITFTHEESLPFINSLGIEAGFYYHSARFIRFAEALEGTAGPLIMIDVDALATGDVRPLLARTDDCALRVRAGRLEPWNQFSACFVLGTDRSRAYFRRVADIVKADLPMSWWGLDQYAMYSAYIGTKPKVALIGPDIAGVTEDTPGLIWYTAGGRKKDINTNQTPYSILFQKYRERNL